MKSVLSQGKPMTRYPWPQGFLVFCWPCSKWGSPCFTAAHCLCLGSVWGSWWGRSHLPPSTPELVTVLTLATAHFNAGLYSSHYLLQSNYHNFDEDTRRIWFPLKRGGGTVNVDGGNTDSRPVSGKHSLWSVFTRPWGLNFFICKSGGQ